MTWSLSASGHTPVPEGESGWEAAEQRLHDALKAVLSRAEHGCTMASFHGNHVSRSDLHVAEPPVAGPAIEDVPLPSGDVTAETGPGA